MNEDIKNDIIMQIEMDSYMKFNDTIATMYDHLEVFGYSDIESMKQAQLEYEKELAYKYLKKEHQALLDIKEYIEKEKNNYMRSCDLQKVNNTEGLLISSAVRNCDYVLDIVNKALGETNEE